MQGIAGVRMWLSVAAVSAGLVGEGLAQISSVTRRTLQTPTPASGTLVVRSGANPQAPGGAVAPPAAAAPALRPVPVLFPVVRPPSKPETPEERAAKLERTVRFQQQQAEAGSATFQYELGRRHLTGDGVPRDAEKARAWLAKASAQGHAGATALLEQR